MTVTRKFLKPFLSILIKNQDRRFSTFIFYSGAPQKGIPGVPGATELEAALRRLTPAEVLARRTNLQHGPAFGG